MVKQASEFLVKLDTFVGKIDVKHLNDTTGETLTEARDLLRELRAEVKRVDAGGLSRGNTRRGQLFRNRHPRGKQPTDDDGTADREHRHRSGHEKFDDAYVFSTQPTFYMFSRALTEKPQGFPTFGAELAAAVRETYVLESTWLTDSPAGEEGHFTYLVRRDRQRNSAAEGVR